VDPFIQAPTNSQSMNPYSYIMNNPLSGTDPTGYTTECVDAACPEPAPVVVTEKRNGVTVTQTLNGTTGEVESTSISSSNGAMIQTTGTFAFDKMSNRDKAQINAIVSSSSNTYKDVDGNTQTVGVGKRKVVGTTVSFVSADGKVITRHSAAANRAAGEMQILVNDALASGDQKYIDGLRSVTVFIDTEMTTDEGDAEAIQGLRAVRGPAYKFLAFNPSIGRDFNNDLEVLFAAFHEAGHLYASRPNWDQMMDDEDRALAEKRFVNGKDPSEFSASIFANTRIRQYASDAEIRKFISKDLYYDRESTQDARRLGGVK